MRRAAPALLLSLWLLGCGSGDERAPAPTTPAPAPSAPAPAVPAPAVSPPPAVPAPAAGDPAAAAAEVFATRCALCHGPEGRGDGPGAVALDPKPRNYGDKSWQASATDAQIRRTILEGGAAVGKSAAMPAHPDLAAQPDVLAALVAKVRAFGK